MKMLIKFVVAFLCVNSAFAESPVRKAETYRDIIEKAQNLSLQKDRPQALNILQAALQKETKTANTTEIKNAILSISSMFLSDRAQQLYETAISLKKNDLSQGLDKAAEALKHEPDNITIVTEYARMLIRKDDCRAASDLVNKHPLLLPLDEELSLTLAQANACLGRWPEVDRLSADFKKKTHEVFWLVLEIEKNLLEKQYLVAQNLVSQVIALDQAYPEVSYWDFRLRQLQKINASDAGVRYLANCKNISAVQYRKYMVDPMLCSRLQQVESEMKNANGV